MKSIYSSESRNFINHEDRFIRKIMILPWFFIFAILIVCGIGIALMYSAGNGSMFPWANKQIIHLSVAFPIMLLVACINIRFYYNLAYPGYIICLAMLIYVELFGHRAMGAVRWIDFGYFKLQPSDIMKIAIIIALAKYFHNLSFNKIGKIIYLFPPLVMIIVPIILIVKQPDLGTSIILLLLSATILFVAGIRIWKFMLAGGLSLALMPIMWKMMHDYQKTRVIIFLNPESDPLGAGYNIMQSKIAIGSSGFFGKGFLQGSQSHLSFLPEKHTDFIFTMFAEEFGFAGCMGLLFLYVFIIGFGIKISLNCKNHFGRILSIGCISLLFIHILINIAMVMGLIPVVGAPLPLLSYGGTIMITIFISFGLILSTHVHRKVAINSGVNSVF